MKTKEDSTDQYVEIQGRRLKLSNPDKIFYPETGFTKAEVIDYYYKIGKIILPHLKGRPLTLKRYPDGVEGEYFYEKECPSHHPSWLSTVKIPSTRRKFVNFCVIEDIPSLVWAANLASLEMHTSLSYAYDMPTPTAMVFDLDPGEPAALLQCIDVAFKLREMLQDFGLEIFPKTSGGKGLHVYVPLNTPTSYDDTKSFAHAVANLLEKKYPDLVTSNMRKDLRKGKVFVDWSQNDDHKTTVCVYSLRARPRPTVSAPATWDRLKRSLKSGDARRLILEADAVLKQVKMEGDLFAPVLEKRQKLPKIS